MTLHDMFDVLSSTFNAQYNALCKAAVNWVP